MNIDYSNIDAILQNANLASTIDDDEKRKIAGQVVDVFEQDLRSRYEWENSYDEAMKLATQVMEEKSWPWRNASNVKYPLVATASMQFHARAYPTLLNGPQIVKALVYGDDPAEEKAKRAERISKHMSYQLMEEMEGWDEDMDRLCYALPIAGCVFKKVYFDPEVGHNQSEFILPKDLVINYWARSLEEAYSKTHIIYKTKNKIKECINAGYFDDFDVEGCTPHMLDSTKRTLDNAGLSQSGDIEYSPLMLLEQHTYYDLDKDGYAEPYIITVEYSSRTLLRIRPRYEKDGVVTGEKGKIIKIVPDEMFLKYTFIPNPDGGFYDLGFGALLGPLNMATNTLLNQLIDAGTLNNLQGGFISKGIRMKAGDTTIEPGEWKFVSTASDDLKKGIFPLPTKEPSDTLFKLLGTIVESGEKLASVAEIFVGKMPGQNTPATTTMATIEQGMKVFTAIYKRIYRSLTKEFKRIYKLNAIYLEFEEEFKVMDSQELQMIGQSDYQMDDTDVRPMADPSSASETLRLTKAQALLELIPLGLNPQEALRRILEAQDQPEIDKLISAEGPPPDPKQQEMQMKMQMEQQKVELAAQKQQAELQMKQQLAQLEAQVKQMEMQFKAQELQLKAKGAEQEMLYKNAQMQQDTQANAVAHQQKIQQNDQAFAQKQQQMKVSQKEKAKNDKSKSVQRVQKK